MSERNEFHEFLVIMLIIEFVIVGALTLTGVI